MEFAWTAVVLGSVSIFGALFNWSLFLEPSQKHRFSVFTSNLNVRLFYSFLGLGLIAIGLLQIFHKTPN